MLKAKKNSMYIDVTGVDDMTDRSTLMEEIIRRNCDVDPRIIKSLVNKLDRCGDENHKKMEFEERKRKENDEFLKKNWKWFLYLKGMAVYSDDLPDGVDVMVLEDLAELEGACKHHRIRWHVL